MTPRMRCLGHYNTHVRFASMFVLLCGLLCPAQLAAQSVAPSPRDRETHRDSPKGQSEWFLTGRRYPPPTRRARALAPAQTSAAEKLRQAFAESDRMRSAHAAFVQPAWNELGPEMILGDASEGAIVYNSHIVGKWAPWQLTLSVIRCEENANNPGRPLSLRTIQRMIMRGQHKLPGRRKK
jgi:hypothetical protein